MFALFEKWSNPRIKESSRRPRGVAHHDSTARSLEVAPTSDIQLMEHLREEAEAIDYIVRPSPPPLRRKKGRERKENAAKRRRRDENIVTIEADDSGEVKVDKPAGCGEGCRCSKHVHNPSPQPDSETAYTSTCLPLMSDDVITLAPCGCKRGCTQWFRVKSIVEEQRRRINDVTISNEEKHERYFTPHLRIITSCLI